MAASGHLEIEQARRLVLAAVRPLAAETVELSDALGRALAEDVVAEQPVPAFEGSAMDGFAVRAADLASAAESPVTLVVIDESRAGVPTAATIAPGQAIAISTGAVMPAGADAVVRVEDTTRRGDVVEVRAAAAVGENVRRAGEDVLAGATVLHRGARLGPAELGVLASLGRASARCARRPRLSVLVSGDELLDPGAPARPGGVRDSNTPTISALAMTEGAHVVRTAHMPDDPLASTAAIEQAIEGVDVAVICGGVSVGEHDHVRSSLHELGALEELWGLALKPGHPTWFGTLGATLIFGLPGNPVSAMVTFVLLVRPALRALLGLESEPPRATAVLEHDYLKPAGRSHAVRCRLSVHEDGWHATLTGPQGSHILTSMLGADALAMIPSDVTAVRAGERVEIEPLAMRDRWAA
jgi:molybdopterin molybdotransferase